MSLLQRKKRPIRRDSNVLRDDRLFFVACDDTYAPKQYFDAFQLSRIQILVVPTDDGASYARQVMDRLESFEFDDDDERWMLLDTDHCIRGTHLPGFLAVLREARQKGVKVALSRPCFEIWLALHHDIDVENLLSVKNAREVEEFLRRVLGGYDKTNIRPEQYPLPAVRTAIERARAIDEAVGGGDIPDTVTTRVYQLWLSICAKALPSQLPEELRGL